MKPDELEVVHSLHVCCIQAWGTRPAHAGTLHSCLATGFDEDIIPYTDELKQVYVEKVLTW